MPLAQRTVIESRIELPSGWTAALPEGTREAGPQGSYEIAYAKHEGDIVARRATTACSIRWRR